MLQLLLGFAVVWLFYSVMALAINIRRAKLMDIPLIVVPVSPMNVLWIVMEPVIFRVLDSLPFRFDNFHRYGPRGWHFHDKAASHLKFGDAFALVTPRETFLHNCGPNAVNDIFARRNDFIRPVQLYKMLNIFGTNVATAPQTEWQHHRKIVAASFNGHTNTLAWSESINQAGDMIQEWTRCGSSGTVGITSDIRNLCLNVLATIGFRKSPMSSSSVELDSQDTLNFRKALKLILDNALFMMLVPPTILAMPFVPKEWARVGKVTNDFRQCMMNMLNEERRQLKAGKPDTGSFMSLLLRASEFERTKKAQN